MIRSLTTKDLSNFLFFCSNFDKYSDFYVIKNSKRMFLNNMKVCRRVFNDCLKRGDKCLISEENDVINGVLIINGYAEKFPKKYAKAYSKSAKIVDNLLKHYSWECPKDLYIRVKKDNPIFRIAVGDKLYSSYLQKPVGAVQFLGTGFKKVDEKGKEVLLVREYNTRFDYSKMPRYIKEDDLK